MTSTLFTKKVRYEKNELIESSKTWCQILWFTNIDDGVYLTEESSNKKY